MSKNETKQYWLDHPGNRDKLFNGLAVLVCLFAIPDILYLFGLFYDKHPLTELEHIPVFYGLYAIIAFLTLMAVARFIRPFLEREEDYYD